MMFAYFKLYGGIFCFFTNSFLCVYAKNIADVVKDFVAVSIISQIDDLMVGTLTQDDCVDQMRLYVTNDRMRMTDEEIWKQYIIPTSELYAGEEARDSGEYKQPLELTQKAILVFNLLQYRVVSIVYHLFYFYFAPFYVAGVVIYSQAIINPAAEPHNHYSVDHE